MLMLKIWFKGGPLDREQMIMPGPALPSFEFPFLNLPAQYPWETQDFHYHGDAKGQLHVYKLSGEFIYEYQGLTGAPK